MNLVSLEEILPEFTERVSRIVWAQMATVDSKGRPRVRVVHVLWDETTGFLTTAPGSPKLKHLANNPNVSIGYWDPVQTTVMVECLATVIDDVAEKARVFELCRSTPEPYGFDPSFWGGTPDNPGFALVRLDPWQIELAGYPTLWDWESKVWNNHHVQ
jgi:uncharacterized pyridoxamine 5'-phosphate oxidase family protein